MRRLASEVIRNLETRIARLEKQAEEEFKIGDTVSFVHPHKYVDTIIHGVVTKINRKTILVHPYRPRGSEIWTKLLGEVFYRAQPWELTHTDKYGMPKRG